MQEFIVIIPAEEPSQEENVMKKTIPAPKPQKRIFFGLFTKPHASGEDPNSGYSTKVDLFQTKRDPSLDRIQRPDPVIAQTPIVTRIPVAAPPPQKKSKKY